MGIMNNAMIMKILIQKNSLKNSLNNKVSIKVVIK